LESIGNDFEKEVTIADENALLAYERLRHVIRHIQERITSIEVDFISPSVLDQFNNVLSNTRNTLATFQANNGEWNALIRVTDSLLDHLHALPTFGNLGIEKDYAKALEDYRNAIVGAIKRLNVSIETVQTEGKSMSQKLVEFSEKLKSQDVSFEQQKGRIDDLITRHQQVFNDSQNTQNAEFQKAENKRVSDHDGILSTWKTEIEKWNKDSDKVIQDSTKKLDEQLKRAKDIVGIISNTGMGGNYQKIAHREFWSAEIFRGLSVLFLILVISIVIWVVYSIHSDFNWQMALFRLGVGMVCAAPAYYCAKESSKHRRSEAINRKIALEFAAIGPYLEQIDKEKGKAIIEKLATQYFGQDINSFFPEDKGFININIKDLEKLAGVVEKIGKVVQTK
jgi:hypothetical protein